MSVDQGRQRIRFAARGSPDCYGFPCDPIVGFSDLDRFRKVAAPVALIPINLMRLSRHHNKMADPGAVQIA